MVVADTLVMLSDRAPGLLRGLSERIDAGRAGGSGMAGAVLDAGAPQSDFVVHALMWAAASLLLGLAARSWRSLAVSGASVALLSTVVEGSQRVLTSTRAVQLGDVVANTVGVVIGSGLVVAVTVGRHLARRRR